MASVLSLKKPRQQDDDESILTLAHQGEPPIDASDEDKAAYGLARYVIQNDYFRQLVQKWVRAILFLHNRHYAKYDARSGRIVEEEVPPWRQQPVNPLTFAVYRSAIAKLLKRKPVPEVVPPSMDTEDREAAALGEALLTHLHRLLKKDRTNKRAIGWLLAAGNVYFRVYWDAEAGDVVALTEPMQVPDPDNPKGPPIEREAPCDAAGDPIMKEDGTPDWDAEPAKVPRGEIAYAIESPLSVRFNPEAETAEDATEMFVAKLWPKARAASHFDVPVESLSNTDDEREELEDALAAAAANSPDLMGLAAGVNMADAIGDRCLVIEYYRKPCDEYPEGRHWIQCGTQKVWPKPKATVTDGETEKVVDEGDSAEYPNGEAELPNGFWPPLVPLQDTPDPSQPHAIGLLPTAVVPINEQYNFIDAKILEHEATMAMGGIWFVHPEDKHIVITSNPAQVKVSKGYGLHGRPPVQAKLEALPNEVYNERPRLLEFLQLVSGMGELGMGQKPEGVTSGRGFLVLQEVVDSVLTPTLTAFEQAMEEVGRRELILAQRHYTEERLIHVRGERGKWEVRRFKGADLRDGLDVRVQTGSSFPTNKAAMLDTALSIVQALPGLVNNEAGLPDAGKLAKFLDVGGIQAFQAEDDPVALEFERECAQFETWNPELIDVMMAEGPSETEDEMGFPLPGFWQNHARLYELGATFMSRDRARFNRWAPEAQKAFLNLMLQRKTILEQQVASVIPTEPTTPTDPNGEPAPEFGAETAPGPESTPSDQGLQPADFNAAGMSGPA